MRQIPKKTKPRPPEGNVFKDLGFSAKEAAHLMIRSDLMIRLQEVIASRGLTQARAAAILHVSQPRVSDLIRGRIDLFSTDTLIDMLGDLGIKVQLVVKGPRRRQVA
jgi:predicted XRE-type DNA-binding protein